MDLERRLGPYEVTAVPGPARLRLVWSMPTDEAQAPRVAGDGADDDGKLAILADYRATRAPVASRAAG